MIKNRLVTIRRGFVGRFCGLGWALLLLQSQLAGGVITRLVEVASGQYMGVPGAANRAAADAPPGRLRGGSGGFTCEEEGDGAYFRFKELRNAGTKGCLLNDLQGLEL